ncbi:HEPN domain-containing protein [Azospirillum sp. RWY-5-1]|uniref:HEPN domain-containing protein n=1 Tax=Azospirillum oleiclasticum TaxID=2735135 RepID=A0ABX2T483_9PROT|nr:HEPN domain-containing protein [Azospirillum oleiclasticum]NYZ18097.1 HEPN domain-containing protein [Azospirillum oleiclasticum]
MTPEAQRYLEKAARCLDYARRNLSVGLGNDAARNAYLAAFHAAQALIFECTGKVAKSHQGVHAEFHRLSRDEPAFDPESRRFLSQAYSLKAVADYELGPDAEIPPDRAAAALDRARSVVDVVMKVLDAER